MVPATAHDALKRLPLRSKLLWTLGIVALGLVAASLDARAGRGPSPKDVEIGRSYKVAVSVASARYHCPSADCGPSSGSKHDFALPAGVEVELVFTPCCGQQEKRVWLRVGEEFVPPSSGELDLSAERSLSVQARRDLAAAFSDRCHDLRVDEVILDEVTLVEGRV